MKYPNTLDLNTYRAYMCARHLNRDKTRQLDAINLDWDLNVPEPLKILCMKAIADNWMTVPYFQELPLCEDRQYLLDLLDLNFPLETLCSRVRSDAFWKRAFQHRWRTFVPIEVGSKPWIRIYLEQHLSETVEHLKPNDYDQEGIKRIVELCSPFVRELRLERLQPSLSDNSDHVPLDVVLANLRRLQRISLTYDVKDVGHNFFLGCATITEMDVKLMTQGLERCGELTEFRLHSSKLEPTMMKRISVALGKGCPNLRTIAFPHCRCGDIGLRAFCEPIKPHSFPNVCEVILTNNFLSPESVQELTWRLRHRRIEKLDLRLNPILTEGAIFIITSVFYMPLQELNLSCCSIDEQIEEYLLMLIRFNDTIKRLDISSNRLSPAMGDRLLQRVYENKTLQQFDLRNTDISYDVRAIIDEAILENRAPHRAETATQAEIDRHLEIGRDFLARGQLSDALTHYHAAVEGDPSNYLTYFKRGTVYFALGKAKFAISDFTRVLELKPDFTAARAQRGSVYLKMGDFENAEIDLMNVLRLDPHNPEANMHFSRIGPASEQWIACVDLMERGDFTTAIILLSQLLEVCPWSVPIRESRAQMYLRIGDRMAAVSDFRSVNRLSQDSTEGYNKLARILYDIGDSGAALKEIRECLKLDPEHKDCFPFYKKIKKVDKVYVDAQQAREEQRYPDCIAGGEKLIKLEPDVPMIVYNGKQLLCSCLVKDEEFTDAVVRCREALDIYPDPEVMCDRAEALIGAEMYDEAIAQYREALEVNDNLQRAKDGIEHAQRVQKQAERRDYYKILGVKRTATKQEIVKAYRKAAQKWHPDSYQGDQKKMAEKKFIDVAAAKEVLTDPEKRRQFDAGQDPLDPEAGRNGFGGGNPFHHFHHGSPFQFKFHFT
uniref:J domain-containing protein n=1 Tax=Anopheles christyi TaxID=43041 RepID=A0A182K1I7_9DIPT